MKHLFTNRLVSLGKYENTLSKNLSSNWSGARKNVYKFLQNDTHFQETDQQIKQFWKEKRKRAWRFRRRVVRFLWHYYLHIFFWFIIFSVIFMTLASILSVIPFTKNLIQDGGLNDMHVFIKNFWLGFWDKWNVFWTWLTNR